METSKNIAILGGGNIGTSIARGLAASGLYTPGNIVITRRKPHALDRLSAEGFVVLTDNREALRRCDVFIIAVLPQQMNELLEEIKHTLEGDRHILVSVVSGASVSAILNKIDRDVPVIRAMPNIAIAIRESMTCLASPQAPKEAMEKAKEIFNALGTAVVIEEELMIPATALCACGIAFFLRAIRAASQGGIEIGFHPEEALPMAAQTARGAAALLLSMQSHPESAIDRVTTPRGCTISGLNEMEHFGFSSAMIKGIKLSAEKAASLYVKNGE